MPAWGVKSSYPICDLIVIIITHLHVNKSLSLKQMPEDLILNIKSNANYFTAKSLL